MLPLCEPNDIESNSVLHALSEEDTNRVLRGARKLRLDPGQIIQHAGEVLSFVYFPLTCVVSHSYTTLDGLSVSMALTGNDGMLGVPLLLGAHIAPHDTVVQIGGYVLKVPASTVSSEFSRCSVLRQALLEYMHAFIMQLAQTAACNRLHSLEQRLCRWLVFCHDRVGSNEMIMTHEAMASMVGGRRESVTVAAGRLQELGVIRCTRGRIHILDRGALEGLACECSTRLVEEVQPPGTFNLGRRVRSSDDGQLSF